MIAYCNFIPDAIWIRGLQENGDRHITLRRNFTEEITTREGKEEKQFMFEETDVFIPERDNIAEFINSNFGNLFKLGLQQTQTKTESDSKIQKTKQIINNGQVVDDLHTLGQQITAIMLGV